MSDYLLEALFSVSIGGGLLVLIGFIAAMPVDFVGKVTEDDE